MTVRVALTGALGVNGVFVLRELLAHGADLLATSHVRDFGLAPELENQVGFERVDVCRLDELRESFAAFRPEVIIHLAAILPVEAQADPRRGFEVNVMGTANVLAAARELGTRRVVFTSSKAAYGAVGGEHGHPTYRPIGEDDRCNPRAVYDHAKLASEGLGANFARTGGPEFVALRFATIFGPGKVGKHGPMSLASSIVEDAVAGRTVRIERGGDQRDDYIYAVPAAEAIVAAALHPAPLKHHVYNIGSGRGTSLTEYAALVKSEVPEARQEIGPGLDPMGFGVSYYSVFDCSRAAEFGFEPPDLQAGIHAFVAALRAQTREAPGDR